MKKLLLILTAILFCINVHSQLNLVSKTMRIKYQNQNKTWSDWYVYSCNVPIYFSPEQNILIAENALNQTFSLSNKKHTLYKSGVVIDRYVSEDYEGRKLNIAITKYKNKTFKVSFIYDIYKYEYLNCTIKTKK